MNDFKLVSTDEEFSLWVSSPMYKNYVISEGGHIRNTKTGENCGREVILRKHYYDGARRLEEPIYDEDCYEFVIDEVIA